MSQAVKLPDIIAKRQKLGDTAVLGAIGAFGLYAAYTVLPYALNMLNMIQTGLFRLLAIGAAAVVGYVGITMLPTLIRALKVLSRFLTNQLVAIDPIGFMKEMMSKLQERQAEVREKVGALKASLKEVEQEEKELLSAIAAIKRKAEVVEDARQAEFLGRDLERKEKSLANVQARLELFRRYDTALKEAREIVEIRQQDLQSELEEAERNWRLAKSTSGLAEDMRSILSPSEGDIQWGDALLQVDTSVNETFASLDLLMEDMSATIANRKLDGSVAVARIAELRQQATPVRVRVADDVNSVDTTPLLREGSVPRIDIAAISKSRTR